jgi:hypothetical protein
MARRRAIEPQLQAPVLVLGTIAIQVFGDPTEA